MSELRLRAWQAQFVEALAEHRGEDFLLVACPAAGKTIAAAAGAARLLAERNCDQLVIACPTVVVRNQWRDELEALGYKMRVTLRGGWPAWVHGACVTYSQIAYRYRELADQVQRRRTVAVFDEIHHAGVSLAWGQGLERGFAEAKARLLLSGTPFRSDGELIPFVRYDADGVCKADFTYDYPQAVRDGVCRPIDFEAHDGLVTWVEGDGQQRTRRFSAKIDQDGARRRLRASLDPSQPYLRSMLAAADADVTAMRAQIPDAAGLVVCDSQLHALEVDRLLVDVTGTYPVLAISDLPRSHEAITQFAHDTERWIVSVRMVAEGVDIPRIGVIVWATVASTELLVRQVAGRALRARGEQRKVTARVHMPADPVLSAYAERLDVLGGTTVRQRYRKPVFEGARKKRKYGKPERHRKHFIDPAPFVEWFDREAEIHGGVAVSRRCGWSPDAGTRRIFRWRDEQGWGHVLEIYDACHMAGISFEDMFAGPEYEQARGWVNDPEVLEHGRLNFDCVAAEADASHALAPALPPVGMGEAEPELLSYELPELPPSPEQIEAESRARETGRAEVFRLLSVYTRLRREADPAFQVATAHRELATAVGLIDEDADDELIGRALAWIKERSAALAVEYPDAVKAMAKARRRSAARTASDPEG